MGAEVSGTGYWQELLNKAMDGDADAFGELWQKYLRPQKVYPYVSKLLRNAHDVEDVVQNVFTYLFEGLCYRKIKRRDLSSFGKYVFRMTQNMCVNHFREHKKIRFRITAEILEQLQLAGVTGDVLKQLEDLQHHEPVAREKFVKLLEEGLGEQLIEPLKFLILRYSRYWGHQLSDASLQPHFVNTTPQEDFEQAEILRIFDEEIRPTLSEEEWNVFYQKHTTPDFSFRRFSEQTGISVSTLHSRYQKVKEKILNHSKLRTFWKEETRKNYKDFS